MDLFMSCLFVFPFLPAVFALGDPCPTAPTFSNTAANCNLWHTVVSGDTCYSLEQTFGITSQQFLSWNPSVSSDCLTNFWTGEAYCVGVGTKSASCSGSSSSSSSSSSTPSSMTSTSSNSSRSGSSGSSSPSTISSTPNATYSTRWPITTNNLTTIPIDTAWPPTRTQSGQPSYCRSWHLVNSDDSCQGIVNLYGVGVTLAELLEWNPSLGSDCSGLYVGWWVCVGIQPQTSLTLTWSTSATNASVPAPTPYTSPSSTSADFSFTPSPTQAGIPSGCQAFYLAEANDNCNTILSTYTYVSESQFLAWNPALNGNCNGLWLGYYYCVANFGSSPPPMPTVTTTPTPAAPYITAACTAWYNATAGDTCDRIALQFGTFSTADFLSWNTGLASDCSNLQLGLYYCVAVSGTPTSRTTPYSSTMVTSPSGSSLPSGCTRVWFVGAEDTCDSIVSANDISLGDFVAWNPQLKATQFNCQVTPNTYVCVAQSSGNSSTNLFTSTGSFSGTSTSTTTTSSKSGSSSSNSSSNSSTTSSKTTSTSTSTSTGVTTPLPTQSGMVSGCVRFYYVESGDGCWSIATDAGVSLDTFLSWNPGAGSDCSGLWLNSYCCIGISGPATTITSGTAVPTPTSS